MYLFILIVGIAGTLLAQFVFAPPSPHNVKGKVLSNNSNGVGNGIPVIINNTVLGNSVQTFVDAPPSPQQRGSYAATINGSDGDTISVLSWNGTHYGIHNTTLAATTTTANVLLNISRPSETNVTILYPANNTLKNKTISFLIFANISILGNDSTNCNATLNITDTAIMNFTAGQNETIALGSINYDNFRVVNWSVQGVYNGSINMSVLAQCASDGINFDHVNADYRSNITFFNTPPSLTRIAVTNPIDLTAGGNLSVTCNVTIEENNSVADIIGVNATMFLESVGHTAQDDFNTHYTNSSCTNVSSYQLSANYSCGFQMAYFANNGTWRCNITVIDGNNETQARNQSTLLNELFAIEVTPSIIDYGALPVASTSDNVNVTISNIGNVPFNITLRAYAPTISMGYLNLSMTCGKGNISNLYQRYAVSNDTPYTDMVPLNNETTPVYNLTLPQRTNDAVSGNDTNTTFFKIQIPPLTLGACNGSIIFGTTLLGE